MRRASLDLPAPVGPINRNGSRVAIATCFGRIGTAAESVAAEAAKQARGYLASDAVAGEHLADQLLLPFALAGSGAFTATRLNRHARTNMEVISSFLSVVFETFQETTGVRVEVKRKP